MSTFRAHFAVVAGAATLALGLFAGPASADLLPGGGSGGGGGASADPLGVLDPLTPLVPGGDELKERLDESLGNGPVDSQPKPVAEPQAGNNGSTTSAPKSSAPQSKAPAKRVSRPTGRTSSTGAPERAKSAVRSAGPRGTTRVTSSKKKTTRDAPRRRSAASPPAPEGPAPTNSFVGSVVDRIPPQYRWPVLVLACLALLFAFTSLRERRRSLRVERAAFVDSLTGLPNRPAFERRLAKEWRRSQRYDRALGLLLIDLDDFKQVNDTQGHAAGDAVLREVAAAISGRIRVSDMAARLGGDEFVVICPETSLAGLKTLARAFEERLQEASINISVGYTEREPSDENPEHFVERADAAMYRRKQRTRGQRERRTGQLATPQPLLGAVAD